MFLFGFSSRGTSNAHAVSPLSTCFLLRVGPALKKRRHSCKGEKHDTALVVTPPMQAVCYHRKNCADKYSYRRSFLPIVV